MSKPRPEATDEIEGDFETLDLEAAFPNTSRLFEPYSLVDLNSAETIVVLDTSTLLLPYAVRKDDLNAIGHVYKRLAEQNRIFIPSRAAREFAKNRERKLGEMVKAIDDMRSRLPTVSERISPLLEGMKEHEEAKAAGALLSQASKSYSEALKALLDKITRWHGDDPVSQLYNEVFRECITDSGKSKNALESEWAQRAAINRPPGYKDKGKADGGLGDFLIWDTVLHIGGEKEKDLAFVTGDVKSDWFVRSGRTALYPRLELVDEYKEVSGGRSFRICSLHELLAEMKVSKDIVEEIRHAEVANTVSTAIFSERSNVLDYGSRKFDYSTHNGVVTISYPDGVPFEIRFNKASNREIYVSRGKATKVARVKRTWAGKRIFFDELESSSTTYAIPKGEAFAVQNDDGCLLIARISDIKDDSRGDDSDLVEFFYTITPPGVPGVMP